MKQLIKILSNQIEDQTISNKTNIVRIEGIDVPSIYRGVCENLRKSTKIDTFVPKITLEKYREFDTSTNASWESDITFLHQGDNPHFSSVVDAAYAAKSYVDFDNAITKWRNESANVSSGTALILLMGTEAAQDTGGLADTSFVISPKEILQSLSKDYSVWFKDIIKNNGIQENYKNAIHTLYRALFNEISTDIFKLSSFIDSLDSFSFASVQELIGHICETLNIVWNVPSICSVNAVPKVSALNKCTLNSARIVRDGIRFIHRNDDIPTASALKKLHQKFAKYAEDTGLDVNASFPEDHLFESYADFEATVTDFMRGINIEQNRKKLLQVDYAIINAIVGTKLPKEPKEKAPTFTGAPLEFYAKMFLDATGSFHQAFKAMPSRIAVKVTRVTLSDCTDDQKEFSYQNICNFVGGILGFFNGISIEVDENEGKLMTFEYDSSDCDDPFNFKNYAMLNEGLIKLSGKWGDPFKINFIVTATDGQHTHRYEYKWAFSPYSPWLNAFSYLDDVLYSSGNTISLPTLVVCQDIQNYLDCESADEFYSHVQQFKGKSLFDQHKKEIHKYFNGEIESWFELICSNFKDFAMKLCEEGLFNASNDLRKLVDSYTKMMNKLQESYGNLTDIQKEKLFLLINSFMVTSNQDIFVTSDMKQTMIPAYNPIMLEKIDAQQLFLRNGFEELLKNQIAGISAAALSTKFSTLTQLASITQGADTIHRKGNEYLTCKNMWEYFGVYFGSNSNNGLLPNSSIGISIVTDDEAPTAMLQNTPMSNIIVRNVMDYIHTFPARADGLNVAFIAPTDMQHIVSAIHSIAKSIDDSGASATINLKFICLNSRKNSATYLRKWLDSYFSENRAVNVNTYLQNSTILTKDDVAGLEEQLKECDICFTYNVLQSAGIQFNPTKEQPVDPNYEKFPMSFTPDAISSTPGKARKVNISQFQFLAAKEHTQISYTVGNPNTIPGMYRAYRTLELPDIQSAIIDIAHSSCRWVVCVDQAIDRNMLETSESKIIGFTTGEGSYGELNVTVSARKDTLTDIKKMLTRRISEKFVNWDSTRLNDAAEFCVDELSKYMDGSKILKALNPYDYEIHNFLAYVLTLQMLGLTKVDDNYIVRSLISLDSYKHWFAEDSETSKDSKRPDFMLIEIPYTKANLLSTEPLDIHITMIECKMAYQNDAHTAKAKEQLEKGLRTMSAHWNPRAGGVLHRYWLNQLYRAIIFSPLNMQNNAKEYDVVREKIYGILDGNYTVTWRGDIFAFWLDVDSNIPQNVPIDSSLPDQLAEEGIIVKEMVCHHCGQQYIQKMLLPESDRSNTFDFNYMPECDDNEDPFDSQVTTGSEEPKPTVPPIKKETEGLSIPRQADIFIPFLKYLAAPQECSRKDALQWFKQCFSITNADCEIVYSNGHPKWETTLDFVITEFRKQNLLENSQKGSFHITELGRRVLDHIESNHETSDFLAVVDEVRLLPISADNSGNGGSSTSKSQPTSTEPKPALVSTRKVTLEDIRVLIGQDRRGTDVYWEFGHSKLANRHILITGTSGQGKTYAIQTMILELARQNISSIVFDYTDGFLPGKLEPEFESELEGRITQEVALINRIPVNPFRLQMMEIPPFGSVPEKSTTVAGRISDILKHVYSFGDQQAASIYAACKQGVAQYGASMDFAKMRQVLRDAGTPQSKTELSKMAQFFDMDLFDSSREFDWQEITQGAGKVTVIQLTGLDRELQTVVTEIMMWDAWYGLTKFGNKNAPFVVVLDEAQNLSFKEKSPAEKILREGRKYGWSAWFATQFLKGALDSGEISNLQQAAERLYFKPTGEEMNYISDQIADTKAESAEWLNILKSIQKGQCIVQGDRIRPNGKFGSVRPALVSVTSFDNRIGAEENK